MRDSSKNLPTVELNDSSNVETGLYNRTSDLYVEDTLLIWSWFVVMGIVTVGLISNLTVIHAICSVRRFCRQENLMLANLSITSVMTLWVYVTANLLEKFPLVPYNPFICRMAVLIFQLHLPVEGLTVMFLSTDRTKAVRRPLERPKMAQVWRRVAAIWVFALLVNIPAGYMIAAYVPDNNISNFKCKWSYSFLGSTTAYVFVQGLQLSFTCLVPSAIMIIDLFRLAEQLKFLVRCEANQAPSGFIASRRRLIRNSLIFTSVFILLRIPAGVCALFHRLPPEMISSISVYNTVRSWRKFWVFAHIAHIAVNPLVVFDLSTEILSMTMGFGIPSLREDRVKSLYSTKGSEQND